MMKCGSLVKILGYSFFTVDPSWSCFYLLNIYGCLWYVNGQSKVTNHGINKYFVFTNLLIPCNKYSYLCYYSIGLWIVCDCGQSWNFFNLLENSIFRRLYTIKRLLSLLLRLITLSNKIIWSFSWVESQKISKVKTRCPCLDRWWGWRTWTTIPFSGKYAHLFNIIHCFYYILYIQLFIEVIKTTYTMR